jgi:hypothetical protein
MVKISEEVWQAIAERGKFGETEDDVLRRVLEIPISTVIEGGPMTINSRVRTYRNSSGHRERFANQRVSPNIEGNTLYIDFEDGNHSEWQLPEKNDKVAISSLTHNAISWAKSHGATLGQINYIRKVLTSNGYHITK